MWFFLAQVCNFVRKACSCDQLMWVTGFMIADLMWICPSTCVLLNKSFCYFFDGHQVQNPCQNQSSDCEKDVGTNFEKLFPHHRGQTIGSE